MKRDGTNTHMAEFAVLPIATVRPAPLQVDGERLQCHQNCTVFSLKVSGRSYISHILQRAERARVALGALQSFRDLNIRLKVNLVKTLMFAILVYPPIPVHAMSKKSVRGLQRVQNAVLSFVVNLRWSDATTMERIHAEHDVHALNVLFRRMATQVWQRMADEE